MKATRDTKIFCSLCGHYLKSKETTMGHMRRFHALLAMVQQVFEK